MSMKLNLEKVRVNAEKSATPDLLDRVTYYRAGMEPEALEVIEEELHQRGVKEEEIQAWGPRAADGTIWLADGMAAQCSFCSRPAVHEKWSWHRLWGLVPLFPRVFRYCKDHHSTT